MNDVPDDGNLEGGVIFFLGGPVRQAHMTNCFQEASEIPLLVDPSDCPLPTLDSTRLLAKAAVEYAVAP